MAKASSADGNVLRIRCNSCGVTLKVPKAQGGRFINCPKCLKKTQVPVDQKAADEEARDYGVNKMAYDNTGTCRSCNAKMAKNAVICVKCGFDYRSGKVAEVVDKTKLPSDYPTWPKMLKSMGGDAVTQGTVKILANVILTLVAICSLGLGTTFAILWFVSDGFSTPPAWPWYVGFGIAGLALLVLSGLLQEAFVEAAAKGLYDRAISAGSIPVAVLYFLAAAVPAFVLPVCALLFLAFKVEKKPEEQFNALDPGWFDGAPLPQLTWNADGGTVGAVLAGVLFVLGLIYFYFSIASYITDLSANPVNIFKWIGKSIVDVPAWIGIVVALLGLSIGLSCTIYFGGHALEIYAPWVNMLTAAVAIMTASYALAAAAHLIGQVAKRHL